MCRQHSPRFQSVQALGLGSVLSGVPAKASFPSPRAQTFSEYHCLEALHSSNALPCIVFTLLWMTILPFHCQEISCSNALQHLRGRYFQTGAVPLFVYSYRLAALEDDSSRFEQPWNAYCCRSLHSQGRRFLGDHCFRTISWNVLYAL